MNAVLIERNAERIIEHAMRGWESEEAADEAQDVLDRLDETDLPARAEVTAYTNVRKEQHAIARVFTSGGRQVCAESTHWINDFPVSISREQEEQIRRAMFDVAASGKSKTVFI